MRLVVADCSAEYRGRLAASLPMARRLLVVKADGTLILHGDNGSKPLNWMSAPNVIEELLDEVTMNFTWRVVGAKNEELNIMIVEIHSDISVELGDEPGLSKHGAEAELQRLIAASPESLELGLTLLRREWPTDLGPVDLMCRDAAGVHVAVEIKRIGEIDGVEQLTRYLERLNRDATLRPVRGIYAATIIKPQARVLAESRDIVCVEVDLEVLAGRIEPELTLFS